MQKIADQKSTFRVLSVFMRRVFVLNVQRWEVSRELKALIFWFKLYLQVSMRFSDWFKKPNCGQLSIR